MPNVSQRNYLNVNRTARDDAIFALIDIVPVTAHQLWHYSRILSRPFESLRTTQGRLAKLVKGGFLRRQSYLADGRIGAPDYFQLKRSTWQMLHECDPYPKRHSEPIARSRQFHTRCLAEFFVHLAVAAERRGFYLANVSPEDTEEIKNEMGTVKPDMTLELVRSDDSAIRFRFYVEVDCSTETLRSRKTTEKKWQCKARVYHQHLNEIVRKNKRARVVVIGSISKQRVHNILEVFAEESVVRERQTAIGTFLAEFREENDAVCHPVFVDEEKRFAPMIPSWAIRI